MNKDELEGPAWALLVDWAKRRGATAPDGQGTPGELLEILEKATRLVQEIAARDVAGELEPVHVSRLCGLVAIETAGALAEWMGASMEFVDGPESLARVSAAIAGDTPSERREACADCGADMTGTPVCRVCGRERGERPQPPEPKDTRDGRVPEPRGG